MPKEVEHLISEAREGRIGRREFISQAAMLLGSVVLADVLFDSAIGRKAEAVVVPPDDPDLESGWIDTPAKDWLNRRPRNSMKCARGGVELRDMYGFT